jgi:hypothetical protein
MENVNVKSRASFGWMLSCATMGLVISISPCFAQGDRDASQEPPKAFDPAKDWDSASPALFEQPKMSNPVLEVLGLIDPPKDWFTAITRAPLPPAIPKDETRIK